MRELVVPKTSHSPLCASASLKKKKSEKLNEHICHTKKLFPNSISGSERGHETKPKAANLNARVSTFRNCRAETICSQVWRS